MKINFEGKLPHQLEAIDTVAGAGGLFQGAPYVRPQDHVWQGDVSGNTLTLSKEKILENASRIAKNCNISVEDYAEQDILDFSIEMETGTGKTYVYLRTIFELHKRYGFHKFCIMVPSIAIREGVLKQLEDTQEHFGKLYNIKAECTQYDSKRLSRVRNYCMSNHLSIMVMNTQSFNSDNNTINDEYRDDGNLLKQIRDVEPIIIIDEPQEGFDTDNMKKRLEAFNPLFKLRYSATHKNPVNVIHCLTPYESYNMGLVKKIAVFSIHERDTQNNVDITFNKIILDKTGKQPPKATLTLVKRVPKTGTGELKHQKYNLDVGANLQRITNNPVYHGWIIRNIEANLFGDGGKIDFNHGVALAIGEQYGIKKEDIFRAQITRTIQAHFNHKKRVVPLGIKPLVLFFIDTVANYIETDGIIRKIFEEQYAIEYKKTYGKGPDSIAGVHKGYFAKAKQGNYTDRVASIAENKEAYRLILKDKNRLLSSGEPVEFIFSHSALGVGWDNPNIFTICTLNNSVSQIRKRQEIGRGLRLCVDQNGNRYRDPEDVKEGEEVNLLTIVPNDSYHAFTTSYQNEIREEFGEHALTPQTRDANQPSKTITRKDKIFNSQEFKYLWAKIAKTTKCRIHFDEDTLIKKSINQLKSITVAQNTLSVSLDRWTGFDADNNIQSTHVGQQIETHHGKMVALNIPQEIAKDTAMAEITVAKILQGLDQTAKNQVIKNPMQFITQASQRIKRVMQEEMVRLVKYEKTGETHPLTMLAETIETYREVIKTPNRGVYDNAICDSDVEKNFAKDLDNQNNVKVFLKLPPAYKIDLPYGGTYNPDFALLIETADLDTPDKKEKFYFTVETKGTSNSDELRDDEKFKIQCAIKHFEAIGLKGYLAPVKDLQSFDQKAHERLGKAFFNQ